MRGADLLVQTLKAAGVSRIFSLSGNQIMPVYDACFGHGIEIVHTRHEAAAVFMAEAHAQVSGEVGVALVTAGGGLANALGPLFTASESETPVLLLSGDSPISQDGRGAFQEMDQVPMTAPVTKLSFRPAHAGDLGVACAQAIRTAVAGRPGPVHLALAFDVLEAECGQAAVPPRSSFARVPQQLAESDARLIAQAMAVAKRPVVLCGPVMNRSRVGDLALRLADALDAPVIAMESPRGLKDPALGDIAGVLRDADLIVDLGKRVDFTLGFGSEGTFRPDAGWIVVDCNAKECDRAYRNLGARLKLAILANPVDAAMKLVDAGRSPGPGGEHGQWRSDVARRLAMRPQAGRGDAADGRITSAQLCAAVQRHVAAASSSVVVCDGGEFGQWAQAFTSADTRIVNGVSGVIGGGLCYGLAAAMARPEATVFALMGDGTVGFHLAEIETAARMGAAYVIVIGNDRRWNAEHQIQLREYGPDRLIGCELSAARYDLAAEALGGHGEFVTRGDELDAALSRAVSSGKVACVNVIIDGAPAPAGAGH